LTGNLYKELGVRRVINACSTATHLGGSIPDPRVMEAMDEASKQYVILMELHERVGEEIAIMTGSEAALVTSGATSALQLAAAACVMRGSGLEDFSIYPLERLQPIDGPWKELIQKIPDVSLTKNEIIVQRGHLSAYSYAYRTVGCNLKVVANGDPEQIEADISDRTAAVACGAFSRGNCLPLNEVVEIAHRNGIPVIVDAASGVLPRSKITSYTSIGADLVAISGGKQIGGPNDTGMLCGKKNLVDMAKLQISPFNGIARASKVDRTQIVGLLVALRIFLEKTADEEVAEFALWRKNAEWIASELANVSSVVSSKVVSRSPSSVRAMITFDDSIPAADLAFNLRKGDPSIWVETSMSGLMTKNEIGIATDSLLTGDKEELVKGIKNRLKKFS